MAPKRAAAGGELAAKRAKATPAAPRATEADLDKELNDMIQHAKDGEFDDVFKVLEKYPPYVNEKPEERMYCTMHQACYWGNLAAVKTLVEKYDADIFLPTKDGKTPKEVAKENEHDAVVKYLEAQEKKKKPAAEPAARNVNTDRNRVTATRNDGAEEADLELKGVKDVTLKLGAEGGGILCGAALVYSGDKKQKAVCMSDRKFKTAINHSGDSYAGGKSTHTINIKLSAMPKDVDKVYLTLCSCGPANLSKFKNPTIELLGDGADMIRYNLSDAGKAMSTVMVVLEKQSGSWVASPVGAISGTKFCGNYAAAQKLIACGGSDEASGKTVCFTGALTKMTRAQGKSKAEAAGAKVTDKVSSKTDIVVVGSGAGDKLLVAQGFGCDCWEEDDFAATVDA